MPDTLFCEPLRKGLFSGPGSRGSRGPFFGALGAWSNSQWQQNARAAVAGHAGSVGLSRGPAGFGGRQAGNGSGYVAPRLNAHLLFRVGRNFQRGQSAKKVAGEISNSLKRPQGIVTPPPAAAPKGFGGGGNTGAPAPELGAPQVAGSYTPPPQV